MRNHILVTTALGLVMGVTASFAQNMNPPAPTEPQAQSQREDRAKQPTQQRAPSAQSTQPKSPSTAQSAQPSTPSGASNSETQQPRGQSSPSNAQSQQPSERGSSPSTAQDQRRQDQQPATAQSPRGDRTPSTAQTPARGDAPSTARTPDRRDAPSTAQTPQRDRPAAADTRRDRRDTSRTTERGATQDRTSVSASFNLNDQQRTRVTGAFASVNVRPLPNANFAVSVGTVVPRSVALHTVPTSIVQIAPQFRGYRYVLVRDEIVIVEPRSYRIVAVFSRSGGGMATTTTSRSRMTLSDSDRDVIRRGATTRRATTGGAMTSRAEVRVGDRLSDDIELMEFDETVYREVPTMREYRYITREQRIYLVDPRERVIIEEFD